MNPLLNTYLNEKQYNAICKYWKIIENYKSKLDNFKYMSYEEYSDDEETVAEYIENNEHVDLRYNILQGRLKHYEEEYMNYLYSIGYKFNDQSQNEHLFNLINNGILLD